MSLDTQLIIMSCIAGAALGQIIIACLFILEY
jgi:hypothetical protein